MGIGGGQHNTVDGVTGYYSNAELEHLCRYVEPGMRVVEIGCLTGLSAIHLARKLRHGFMTCVDTWNHVQGQSELFMTNVKRCCPNGVGWWTIQADSKELRPRDMDPDIDFLHIDGDHSFRGVTSDLLLGDALRAKWILVHDYGNPDLPSVELAVTSFLGLRRYRMFSRVETSLALRRVE